MRWIKSKALSMILVIVCATFYVSFLAPEVAAEQQVCCEKTKSGEFCTLASASDCDQNFNTAAVSSCSQASFCRPVCCIDNSEVLKKCWLGVWCEVGTYLTNGTNKLEYFSTINFKSSVNLSGLLIILVFN